MNAREWLDQHPQWQLVLMCRGWKGCRMWFKRGLILAGIPVPQYLEDLYVGSLENIRVHEYE